MTPREVIVGQDVTIKAPPARMYVASAIPPGGLITDKEMIAQLERQLSEQKQELEQLRVAANTTANVAACLAERLKDGTDEPFVRVPAELRERMLHATLRIDSDPTGSLVTAQERAPDHQIRREDKR